MPVLRCKMCGGTMEIDAKQSVAVCQYCGTRQTLPRLDSERVAGLYERAELGNCTHQQKKTAQQKKPSRKLIAIAAAGIIVFASVAVSIVWSVNRTNAYEAAQALLSAGEYAQAAEAFSALDGYKDADACRIEAEAALIEQQNAEEYAVAQELLKIGKFDEAIAAFAALGDYSDSAAQMTAAKQQKQEAEQEVANRSAYEAAEKLLADGDYDAAIEAFTALGDYADASDRAVEAETAKQTAEEEAANKEAYTAAEKLLEEKKYADAKAAFEALGEYSDAKEKSEECQRQLAAQQTVSAATLTSSSTADTTMTTKENLDEGYGIEEYDENGVLQKYTRYFKDGRIFGVTYYTNGEFDHWECGDWVNG